MKAADIGVKNTARFSSVSNVVFRRSLEGFKRIFFVKRGELCYNSGVAKVIASKFSNARKLRDTHEQT
jgi:hypothetical protein